MKNPREVAIEAATHAAEKILALSQNGARYTMKNARDILSEADLASEKIILETIKKYFPNHSILSEETGRQDTNSTYRWVVDPIDGTINFAKQVEEYAISIALLKDNAIVLGLVLQPALQKLYIAEKGRGAYVNEHKIHISTESELINCLIATDNTSHKERQIKNFEILTRISTEVRHVRIFGSVALHLAKVAEGKLDFYYKPKCNYWDAAAGSLLVEEAGGNVTGMDNTPYSIDTVSILASNGHVHQKAVALLQE